LRPYQRQLLLDAQARLRAGCRSVLAYLPTGGGKTRVAAAAMAEHMKGGEGRGGEGRGGGAVSCLFVVNRKSLVVQTVAALRQVGFGEGSVALLSEEGGEEARVIVCTVQSLHASYLSEHSLQAYSLVLSGGGEGRLRRAVESYKRHARGERAIAFTPSVGSAMELAERLRQAGVRAVHVEANTPDEVREGYFEQLRRGKLEVLCNCDVLSEGFDEPSVSCVILLRQTESRRVYIQQVGRGMRPAEGKGRFIVCDEVGATWRHGPITGPIGSDYNAFMHSDASQCPSCGDKMKPRRDALRSCDANSLGAYDRKTSRKAK
ncbi:MAG: hypothetical protein SGPRY_007225, partial [Prymnesium sp.]